MAIACHHCSEQEKTCGRMISNHAAPSRLSLEEADRITLAHAALTVPLAGECLALSRGAAFRAVAAGELDSYKVGRSVRVPSIAVRRLLRLDDRGAA